MPLDAQLQRRLEARLTNIVLPDPAGPRLVDDAQRLLVLTHLISDKALSGIDLDDEAIGVIGYAVQLPFCMPGPQTIGKLGVTPLRERCEQSARLLVEQLGESIDESLLDRAVRVLLEVSQKSPVPDEAKVLADAISLEDFGVTGVMLQCARLATIGRGLRMVVDAFEQRERYGYFDARLRDGFHFDASRQMAQLRLVAARQLVTAIKQEMG
jgi:hypothetical protein